MELLKEVPGSVLWLMKLNDAAQANLTKEAIKHGVESNRIVYATRVPRVEDHLARYRLADLFLDTFPYNGHTTVSDAIMANLSVLTIAGNSFASRVACSLLHDLNLKDFICKSLEEYKNKALIIANKSTLIRTNNFNTTDFESILFKNSKNNIIIFQEILSIDYL
jgi:predicted O-linked N-acetylglucosamine transferase (SPINDLY family)